MKKKQLRLSALVAGICMSLFTMTSCTSEDSVENTGTAHTFMVSESSGDDALSRAAMQPVTATCDLGDGTMLVGTLTEDTNNMGTRASSTNSIANGTPVTYYACDANGKILGTGSVSVTDSKLTVDCPSGTSTVYFYIGSAPSGTVGNTIGSTTTTGRTADYKDMYASASVSAASSDLATLTFEHVFGEAKVTMSSNDATTRVGDFTSTLSGIASPTADVKADGSYTAQGSDQAIACSVSGDAGAGISLSSAYVPFVLTSPKASNTATLTITKVTFGGTEKELTANNTMKFTHVFEQGYKYNFKVELTKVLTRSDYYEWDAYAPVISGINDFSAGNYGFNPQPSAKNTGRVALHSCKDCPTAEELVAYLLAGAYLDKGDVFDLGAGSYSYPPSYMVKDVGSIGTTKIFNNYDKTTHTLVSTSTLGAGLWLPKNNYIKSANLLKGKGYSGIGDADGKGVEDFTGDLVSYQTNLYNANTTLVKASNAATIRTSGNYFFLPAGGAYNRYSGGFISDYSCGKYGYYWTSSVNDGSHGYSLEFDTFGTLNLYLDELRDAGILTWKVQ